MVESGLNASSHGSEASGMFSALSHPQEARGLAAAFTPGSGLGQDVTRTLGASKAQHHHAPLGERLNSR
jgi:hypothetical protein